MGNLDVEGGSIAGRRATGVAASTEIQQLREKRKKEDHQRSALIRQLRDILEQIDRRIADLDAQIEELREQQLAWVLEADEAFVRMHKLEDLLVAAKTNGLSDTEREALRDALGPEAQYIQNDAELLTIAEERLKEERETGNAAQAKADELEAGIQSKMEEMDRLTKERDEISKHPDLELDDKIPRLGDVLSRSLDRDLGSTEADAESKVEQGADLTGDNQRKELGEEEAFDLSPAP